jgi:hypothetical protein
LQQIRGREGCGSDPDKRIALEYKRAANNKFRYTKV